MNCPAKFVGSTQWWSSQKLMAPKDSIADQVLESRLHNGRMLHERSSSIVYEKRVLEREDTPDFAQRAANLLKVWQRNHTTDFGQGRVIRIPLFSVFIIWSSVLPTTNDLLSSFDFKYSTLRVQIEAPTAVDAKPIRSILGGNSGEILPSNLVVEKRSSLQ